MRALIPVILLSLGGLTAFSVAKTTSQASVNWTTFEDLNDLAQSKKWKNQKRMVIVDLYTHWCGWCKRMDANTFGNEDIANYLNENFYSVKFNAEQKEPVTFGGKEYKYIVTQQIKDQNGNVVRERGTHELALALGSTNGRIGYPTTVFLSEELGLIQALPGYLTAEQMKPMLVYYAEGHYLTTPWATFQQEYTDPLKGGTIGD